MSCWKSNFILKWKYLQRRALFQFDVCPATSEAEEDSSAHVVRRRSFQSKFISQMWIRNICFYSRGIYSTKLVYTIYVYLSSRSSMGVGVKAHVVSVSVCGSAKFVKKSRFRNEIHFGRETRVLFLLSECETIGLWFSIYARRIPAQTIAFHTSGARLCQSLARVGKQRTKLGFYCCNFEYRTLHQSLEPMKI